ncbi:MAG: hypothetical protein AVDCRST_MAG85-1556 [uncultured Solirubrobacteraceae bacterium]|uniref:Lipoprotein n=1 Tax=uncultured Solirubrobacteraceae bacterium TaxID=1162706 RepID=A0A6J4SFA3_9ACTN|nr:MAG: hypothetical protein AVDCRST_MAG85-1556 [uncultured Solirubrobacteraceae bacterium]
MSRIPRLAPLAVLLALAGAGCVQITSETSEQLDLIGDVAVHTDLCAEGIEISARRVSEGDHEETGTCGMNDLGRAQLLVAYRVPDGAEPVEVRVGAGLTLKPSPTYADALEARHPTGPGRRWVGYVSDARDFDAGDLRASLDARFTLPDGRPYRGPFPFRTVAGYRELPGDAAPDAPIDCAAKATDCDTGRDGAGTEVDVDQATRDLAILPGDEVVLTAGERGHVPFRAVFAGADDPGLDFALGVQSVDGFDARPLSETLHPRPDSDSLADAVVEVPATAKPGRYRLRMTAALPNGQMRSGETSFVVKTAALAAVSQDEAPSAVALPPAAAVSPAVEARLTVEASAAARRCLSRRTVRIRLRRRGARDTAAVRSVRVNGRPVRFRTEGRTRLVVDLRGLPRSAYAYRIAARLSDGTVLVDPRRYRTCTPKRARRLPGLRG